MKGKTRDVIQIDRAGRQVKGDVHVIWGVELPHNAGIYALDLTSAQYGYNNVMPFLKYYMSHSNGPPQQSPKGSECKQLVLKEAKNGDGFARIHLQASEYLKERDC